MAEPRFADPRVAAARAGDEQAFAQLYDDFAPRIHRFLLVRVREPADAEDLLQRVFLNVIESLPSYQERGLPFGAWLFRIARNAAIDFERGRRPGAPIEAAASRPDESPGPAELVEREAARRRVHEALAALTPDQRDVVIYRFIGGLTPAEIGRLMGKREGTIRALQFRALRSLERLGRAAFDDLAEASR
jgi:RNA polymerase sigma-70 factor (ECF subfamily)